MSMFIDPDFQKTIEALIEIGSPWVELHTGSFTRAHETMRNNEILS